MKELFGQRLREQRLKHHLTLEQVAEKADLSANYIGMVERGLKEPGLATMAFGTVHLESAPNVSHCLKGTLLGQKAGRTLRIRSEYRVGYLPAVFQK